MQRRHPLLWKMALLQVGFCVLLVWLVWSWGLQVERNTYFLEAPDRIALAAYAAEAEQVAATGDADAVERWRLALQQREHTWVAVLDDYLHSLGTTPLNAEQVSHLTFMRKLGWPMSKRLDDELPYVSIAFPQHPERGRLVMQLPERLLPPGLTPWTHVFTHGVVPVLLALGLGLLLYRHLVQPLNELRERANALSSGDLAPLASSSVTRRPDELGELARAYEHMAERLRQSLNQQRQLLRTLSHEIRTPLARLKIASDSGLPPEQLQQRLSREVEEMRRLVDDSLNLAWLDTEKPRLEAEEVVVASVWEALVQDAHFETGWPLDALVCELDSTCLLHVHLNSFAQALENILRNAIRHSPEHGVIRLSGRREDDNWCLVIEDQGPGVAEADLERIFEAYLRLDGTVGSGFGLGLSIARRAIELQGGALWATCGSQGLRMNLRLSAANV
ncbi:histidine kinase sensor domain-containing protein [Pseudomonas sp. FP453]|uniref:HAMP domain-containing sensor histidine kinase n=1 Tax=Pseudomonas sp. FP453 TaxID=2954094 RepID=UPI002734EA38|nr:sensor histidine kinase [Pseudomonas sp. FP453]WLH88530.1 histidine kinase sensor domain-containing protein [Pseudomonas sp. FP453]